MIITQIILFLLLLIIFIIKKDYHYRLLKQGKNEPSLSAKIFDWDSYRAAIPFPILSKNLKIQYPKKVKLINILVYVFYVLFLLSVVITLVLSPSDSV